MCRFFLSYLSKMDLRAAQTYHFNRILGQGKSADISAFGGGSSDPIAVGFLNAASGFGANSELGGEGGFLPPIRDAREKWDSSPVLASPVLLQVRCALSYQACSSCRIVTAI
jgi:hypothetical protein